MKSRTIADFQQAKDNQQPFSVITCYDATFASCVDQAGIDMILVGDSLGMVIQGQDSTLPVSLEDMCYHVSAVARAKPRCHIMADLPFGANCSLEQTLKSASRLMQAGAHSIKIEGGEWLAPTIEACAQLGIPVCAHLGLTPQSVNLLSGYKVQGREDTAAGSLLDATKICEQAGAAFILLECVPKELASRVDQYLSIPTIGIGAGPDVSGQVLVIYDLLGISQGHRPKFVKDFMQGQSSIVDALKAYHVAVTEKSFPSQDHWFE